MKNSKPIYLFLVGILLSNLLLCQTIDKKEVKGIKTNIDSLEGNTHNESKVRNNLLNLSKSILNYISVQNNNLNQPYSKSVSLTNKFINRWIPLGPSSMPVSTSPVNRSPSGIGPIQSVWADPSISSTIYAGGLNGGLWKKELGANWVNLTDQLYSFGVLDIAVDPTNPQKIYIACGCFVANGNSINNGNYGLGVFFSEDGGDTWITNTMSTVPSEDLFMIRLQIDPNYPNTIYALSKTSVYKSTDGGYNWINTSPPSSNSTEFIDIVIKPNNSNTIFICAETNEIYRSFDAGATWESINLANNLSTQGIKTRMGIAVSEADANSIFAIYTMNNENATLEKSTDNGNTWNPIVSDRITSGNYTPLRLSISPTNIDNIYVGGIRFYKYNAEKNEFIQMASPHLKPMNKRLHDDMRDILVLDNAGTDLVYVGHDGGLSRSDDEANTWTAIDNGLQVGLFYSISSCDANPEVLIGGAHDCSSFIYDGSTWYNTSMLYSDGGSALVDDTDKNIMYALRGNYIQRSEDKGATWKRTSFKKIEYDSPILQDPFDNETIYFGEYHLKVSEDKGATIKNLATIGTGRILNMAISEKKRNIFYFTRATYSPKPKKLVSCTLFRRTNNGSSWIELSSNVGSILNEVQITGIKIHPQHPNNVWITLSGMKNGEKIYQSQNGGKTWQNISYNLENFPAQCIEFDEFSKNIYIGTDIGIMYKNVEEKTWHSFDDFPHVLVSDLEINSTSGKLYAATFGRGIWELDIK